jgi:hypothetical protein
MPELTEPFTSYSERVDDAEYIQVVFLRQCDGAEQLGQ